jgi:hypothetical protein
VDSGESVAVKINRTFDSWSYAWDRVRFHAFRFFGLLGMLASAAVTAVLAFRFNLGLEMAALLWVQAFAVAWLLAVGEKFVRGREALVYYHHQWFVLAASAALAAVLEEPVLRWLDVAAPSLGVFLAFGRLGCTAAGCCHGRPAAIGISYSQDARYARPLAGTRLFPVQFVEALSVLGLAGLLVATPPALPGGACSIYLAGYGCLRFGFEFLRGDAARPYWNRLSEAQWTSLIQVLAVAALSAAGVLPRQNWTFLAATAVLLGAVSALRRDEFLDARSVDAIARVLRTGDQSPIYYVHALPNGLQMSTSTVFQDGGELRLVTFGRSVRALSDRCALAVARLIVRLEGGDGERMLLTQATGGVYHLLLPCGRGRHAV